MSSTMWVVACVVVVWFLISSYEPLNNGMDGPYETDFEKRTRMAVEAAKTDDGRAREDWDRQISFVEQVVGVVGVVAFLAFVVAAAVR